MKKILSFALSLIFTLTLFALEVDKAEIKKDGDSIEFINYTGTHSTVDTVEQITGIGTQLGTAVTQGTAGARNRYFVMHIVDPNTKEGFDADILMIGPDAAVDHINNLRLIIAGYLQRAYRYSAKDAQTIAHFVTIYNAVHRKDMNYFTKKYKAAVSENLSADKAGLAIRYDEWPGQTQILIPLSDPRFSGTISAIDTTTISDKEVVEKMREDKDKDISVREDMIDLKEREAEKAAKRAEEAQKQATEAQKKADTETKKADTAQKKADLAKKDAVKKTTEAEAAQKKAEETKKPSDKAVAEQKQKEADAAQKKVDEAQKKATEQKKKAHTAQDQVAKKQKDAAAEQKLADTKEKEAQDDRKNVAADTQKIIEEKAAEKKANSDAAIASAIPGYGLKIVDESKLLSELVLLDLKTAKELKTSAVNTIHGRYLVDANGQLMAIAGTKDGGGVITLVLFDPTSLEVVKQGADNISAQSLLIKNENDYYAVLEQGGKYYIGRFDSSLKLQAKSSIQVLPYSPITIVDQGIMVQATDNSIRLIGLKDLIAVSIQ